MAEDFTHNKNMPPRKAFILGAGFGTRLRPYTDTCPKPMVSVAGRSLISRTLDKLQASGVDEVVVNTHYLADIMAQHLNEYAAQNPDITIHISHEDPVLDTGGGVQNALHYFSGEPFYVIAGDNLFTDGTVPALDRLAQAWDPDKMDILTLMQPVEKMHLTEGVGDYDLKDDGRVHRRTDKGGAYMWTNIRINSPSIYNEAPRAPDFSFLDIMDECEEKGRFYALVHDGEWHHISTPRDLEAVDQLFRQREQSEDFAHTNMQGDRLP